MTDQAALQLPKGFRAAGVRAGIKPSGGLDFAVVVSENACAAAGTFTTNRVCAAPVKWDRALLPSARVRGVVINAGNANAATGAQGEANVRRTAETLAALLNCEPEGILVASTGVIGHQLPMDRVEAGVAAALAAATAEPEGFRLASESILTTDTRPKVYSTRAALAGTEVTLTGMAKGAAMIGPRMATMLGFLFTDAKVDPADLQVIIREAVETSFNCISVEGHTSTNDTVLLIASGDATPRALKGEALSAFAAMVKDACDALARMIPEDGEGATHVITIDVEGCRDREEARTIARTVADSALVKTAVHGADPNWGRIVSAAGYSGVAFDEGEVSLWLNGFPLYRDGTPLPFDATAVSAHLRANRETTIRLTFRRGDASVRFWTSDLTAEYVRLNADYTT